MLLSSPGLRAASSYSARALANNTEYTPAASRPTLVVIAPTIDTDKNEHGAISVQVGASGATVELHSLALNNVTTDAVLTHQIAASFPYSFIVPAGRVYKLVTANTAGSPSFTLGSAQEMTL